MIEIIEIEKSFQDKMVLSNISLTIPEHRTTVIVGPSGCGKTVLLRSIIGLIHPDKGQIRIQGEDITQLKRKDLFEIRKKMGMLFQGAALFDSMTVEENIGLPLREHRMASEKQIRERVREKLDWVGLSGIENNKPSELSGGMKKRVGLARALIMDPQVILFDEPTTGLDPIMSGTINDLILHTRNALNITSIVVTHDMESAFYLADHMAMIHEGRIIFTGTPDSFRKSKNQQIKLFIGGYLKNNPQSDGSNGKK